MDSKIKAKKSVRLFSYCDPCAVTYDVIRKQQSRKYVQDMSDVNGLLDQFNLQAQFFDTTSVITKIFRMPGSPKDILSYNTRQNLNDPENGRQSVGLVLIHLP